MELDYLSSITGYVKLSCMTISQLLRDHFDKTGEQQAAFARRVGLTPQTVSQLLRGDIKVPTADVRRKLAKAFRLRHVDILVMVGEVAADEIESHTPAPSPEREAVLYVLDQMEPDLAQAYAEAGEILLRLRRPQVLANRQEERVPALR